MGGNQLSIQLTCGEVKSKHIIAQYNIIAKIYSLRAID